MKIPAFGGVVAMAVLAGCGASPPASAPAQAEGPKEAVSADAGASASGTKASVANDAAAVDALTKQESQSGTCDDAHKAALERFLDELETNLRGKSEEGKPIKIESFTKRTISLSDASKGFALKLAGRGTQVHVLAFSAREVSLDALAGTSAATTMRSPYQRDVTNGPTQITLPKTTAPTPLESDSRQIEMKPGQELQVKLRGQGCAAVVVFSKV